MNTKLLVVLILTTLTFNCSSAEDVSEKEIINTINELDSEKSLHLFGGLKIDQTEEVTRSFKPIYSKTESVLDRFERYLQTHELNFSFEDLEKQENGIGRSESEEYRSKRMKKMLVPFLLALKVKMAIIMKALLMIVKFISLKALAAGFLALIFSGATFFKDLLAKKQDHVTTAYITGSPLNAEIVHSDWHRNGQASPQELAYNYHAMGQPTY